MASNGHPPPAKFPFGADRKGTTIDSLPDDVLREFFIRLDSLSDLVRASCTCLAWQKVVTSCRSFRRQFIALHPPPLLGHFFDPPVPESPGIPAFAPTRRSDPEPVAAILSGDFFLTTLQAPGLEELEGIWSVLDARGGYLLLSQSDLRLLAVLNPLARRCVRIFDLSDNGPVHIFDDDDLDGRREILHAGLLCDEENPATFGIFCLAAAHGGFSVRAAVFSSFLGMGGDWFLSPWLDVPQDPLAEELWLGSGMRVGNFIYWPYQNREYVVVLNPDPNSPRLFVEMIPPILNLGGFHSSILGQIDGVNMCIACSNEFNISVMLRQEDGLQAGTWAEIKVFNLADEAQLEVRLAHLPNNVIRIVEMRGSIVYLTTSEMYHPPRDGCWFLSLCLRTDALELLFHRTYDGFFQPYHHSSWSTFLLPESERFYHFI